MNPYALLGSRIGTSEAGSLCERLAVWHDSMVTHERRLRAARTDGACDDECPHVEARTLWVEAVMMFGDRATELRFLCSRATSVAEPKANLVAPVTPRSESADAQRPPIGRTRRLIGDSGRSLITSSAHRRARPWRSD
jgi:hypothetical protein